MKLDIESQVRKLGNHTNLQTVIREAVVNSIQADATKIDIAFKYASEIFDSEDSTPVVGIQVSDNGAGFTKENINSFCIYGSRYKIELGCKGVGRLCFLKVFDQVQVKSRIATGSTEVSFKFDVNFEKSQVESRPVSDIDRNITTIIFSNIRSAHERPYDIVETRNQLYNHVLPMLYLIKDKQIVNIHFQSKQEVPSISTENLPNFEQTRFSIHENITNDKQRFKFTMHYAFEKSKTAVLNDYYCANGRTVFKFNDRKLGDDKIKIIPVSGKKITFLLTGKYLDDRCNEERNEFGIYPRQIDMVSLLSWKQINSALRPIIKRILDEKAPAAMERNEREIQSIKADYLHLTDYFDDLDALGGAVDSESIIRIAEKRFLDDKLDFRKKSRDEKADSAEIIKKASDLAGKELIEYVLLRDGIISRLEELHIENNSSEGVLHDLFLKRGADVNNANPVPLKENNLWLLDDKFMSYCYAASDKTIRVAGHKIGYQNPSSGRPDISIFFQNGKDNHNAVIVELKALGTDAPKKFAGLLELREYAASLRGQENLDTIWYYLITKIDKKFENQLEVDGYKRLFSVKDKTYFKYYDQIGLNLYILSSDTLIADAKARNKTFIDLVRGNAN